MDQRPSYPSDDQVEEAVQRGRDVTKQSSDMLTGPVVMPDPIAAEKNELLEMAWGLIANAGGGDWTTQTAEWQAAAASWRDRYHAGQMVLEEVRAAE